MPTTDCEPRTNNSTFLKDPRFPARFIFRRPSTLNMKTRNNLLAAGILLAAVFNGFGQPANKAPNSGDGLWQAVEQMPAEKVRKQRSLLPGKFRAFSLNHAALDQALTQAPKEFTAQAWQNPAVLTLPMPDGSFARFRIVESPIMEPELAAKFPEIKTYSGQGLDDPTATVRFDITPEGFRAQVLSPQGAVYVEPYSKDIPDLHASYYLRDAIAAGHRYECLTTTAEAQVAQPAVQPQPLELDRPLPQQAGPASVGQMLLIYRLAVAADGEYTALNGDTAPVDGLIEYLDTNPLVGTAFYRTVQP